MEHIVDERGRMRGSPDAQAAVVEHVERALGALIHSITVEEQFWSASGALHLAGVWQATQMPVLIKLGVNRNQLYWTQQTAAADPGVVPLLYVSGDHLGELQIGWTVMERVEHGPLGPDWNGDEFEMLLEAAVRFQRAARMIEPRHIIILDASTFRRWVEVGLPLVPPGPVTEVMQRFEQDWTWISSVCQLEVCHGDVHMCNVLTRTPAPCRGDGLLIDCQPVVQPWVFDAAYPQILNSVDRSRIGYTDLVPRMAHLRSAYGMSSCEGPDLEGLACISLAWYAIRMWGLCPDRHALADYRHETERYITASAAIRPISSYHT